MESSTLYVLHANTRGKLVFFAFVHVQMALL
jgi:hypothetical protein